MNLKEILKKLKLSEQNVSMVLGALVIVVIGVLIFNYFQGRARVGEVTTPVGPVQPSKMVPEGLPTIHKVEKGEHLWKIAERYYGSGYNWVDIVQENKLSNPNRLLAGQELTIPKVEVRKPVFTQKGEVFGEPITEENYTVVPGDHLWGIAVRAYQDGYRWTEIAKVNNLTHPDLIHPGNVLTLPR